MKYWRSILEAMKPSRRHRLRCVVVAFCFLSLLAHPSLLTASAGVTQEDGDLFLSCRADNDCVLTPTPIGEEQVSDQTFANVVQPETVVFEFVMDPPQHHVALLPEVLKELEIDFKHQTEAGSLFRPAMDLRLVLGDNVNEWNFEASNLPEVASTPYRICLLYTSPSPRDV